MHELQPDGGSSLSTVSWARLTPAAMTPLIEFDVNVCNLFKKTPHRKQPTNMGSVHSRRRKSPSRPLSQTSFSPRLLERRQKLKNISHKFGETNLNKIAEKGTLHELLDRSIDRWLQSSLLIYKFVSRILSFSSFARQTASFMKRFTG